MKFGLNSFLTSSGFTNADLPLIGRFQRWGADVFEPAIVDPAEVDTEDLARALDGNGMKGSPICGVFPPGRDLRGSSSEQQACLDYMFAMIDLTAGVGSSLICGPIYSSVGRCNAHTADEKARHNELVAKNLQKLCEPAAAAGITLALEPLNRFETDFLNTLDQAKNLIKMVGSPALKIHVDTFHMNIEEANPNQAVRSARDLIAHVHASATDRGIPGRDHYDWAGFFETLKDIQYSGDIVVESFAPENTVIARAASIWLPRYDCPEELGRESLEVLREIWREVGA